MKKFYLSILSICAAIAAYSQCSVVVNSSTPASCFGACDGSVNVSSLGLPPFTYSWQPGGQTVQNPNDLCAGSHTVTMLDANSCQSTATVTITQPNILTANSSTTNGSCYNSCDATASTQATGGTPPYFYNWSNGDNTQTADSLCPGTYTVTVTDINGCATSSSVTVTEPPQMAVASTSTDASCLTCNDGTATAVATGGTPGYTYIWSNGQTTQTATGLLPGSYTVCVTDQNSCTLCDTVIVDAATGIFTTSRDYGVTVYPNPSYNHVNIEMLVAPAAAKVRVALFDVTGKSVLVEEYTAMRGNIRVLNVDQLPPGVYMLELRIDGEKLTHKVIKH